MTVFVVIAYILAAVGANLAVSHWGPQAMLISAFLMIGLDLSARDYLHTRWESKGNLFTRMFLLVLTASALTVLVNWGAGMVALASFVAFFVAGIVDTLVYSRLKHRGPCVRVNGSNIFSAMTDSILFPVIAFGVVSPALIASQFFAKVAGGFFWSFVYLSVIIVHGIYKEKNK